MRQIALMTILFVAGLTVAYGTTKSYDIVPYKGCVAQTPLNTPVSQYIRNTLDSLSAVSVWIGDTFDGEPYTVEVLDSASTQRIAYSAQPVHATKMWAWTEFPLTKDADPVRGRTYKVVVSRPTGAAISFAYCDTNPYKYGSADVPGSTPPLPAGSDVALRICGLRDTIGSELWGATSIIPSYDAVNEQGDTVLRANWGDSMRSSGAHWGTFYQQWDWTEYQNGAYWFDWFDSSVASIAESAGMEPVAVLFGTPKWASTRVDSHWVEDPDPNLSYWSHDTSIYCPPRNMWPGTGETNYWVRYLDTLLSRDAASLVHTWSIWNESNEGATTYYRPDSWPGYTGWWRRPNRHYIVDTTWRARCTLYVRLCSLAASAIRSHPGHGNDRIIIGEVAGVNTAWEEKLLVPGKEWLRAFYDIAVPDSFHHPFWSVVSAHPYQGENLFNPEKFASDAETLRAVMREHNDTAQLWCTEFDGGYRSVVTADQNANTLCEDFISTSAQAGLPGGTFDRTCWWLSWQPPKWAAWALFDSFMNPHPGFYAFKQVIRTLTGKRFNRRVMTGDARDTAVRMYEFEDTGGKRTWVSWLSPNAASTGVSLPARNDEMDTVGLDYNGTPPAGRKETEQSGWLNITQQQRPVFVVETDSASRPDLVVDSLLVTAHPQVGSVMDVHSFVHNEGSESTPGHVRLDLLCNGDSFASAASDSILHVGDRCEYSFEINNIPAWMHGWSLFSARVNPGQAYVEKTGMDDNTGYVRRYVSRYPTGELDAVLPPGGKTNEPLVLFKLGSRSWEADTLDSVPCDSTLLIQRYYGLRDSAVHNTDTLGWFAFRPETSWTFLHGPGRYRFYLVVKDSWSASAAISDTSDSIVVFDTVPAVGSVNLNSGARFAKAAECTLGIAVADSCSGLRAMRLGTRLSNFLRNSGCAATDGVWSFSGGTYDTAVSMIRLNVGTSGTSTLYQTIPSESLWPHMPDTFHLTADAIVSLPGAGATAVGCLRFGYRFTHLVPARETLTVIASIPFTGGIACHTGTSNLDTSFTISPPPPDTFWQFAGGYVEAAVSGSGTSGGQVFFDNIKIENSGPYPWASWWRPCSTAAVWMLAGDCGWRNLYLALSDSAGCENSVPLYDSIILDNQSPNVHIGCPEQGAYVNGTVSLCGIAFDTPIPNLDTFFEWRRLEYRELGSPTWLPCDPDSVSFAAAWPGTTFPPDVYLGSWNTTGLDDGVFYLRLSAKDSAGSVASNDIWVVVSNDSTGDNFRSGPPGGGSGLGEGSIYVGSSTGYLLHLSDDLDSLSCTQLSDSGSQAYVTAILETGDDSLLVLDARGKCIHKLSRTGQNRRRLVSNLTLPVALSKDAHDNLWLVDRGTNRIGKFRSNGTLVFTRGGQGRDSTCLNSPEAIAVKDSLVYVANTRSSRIVVMDTCGNYQGSITGDFDSPTAIVVTDSGSIYVTDGADGSLKGITPRGGRFLTITETNGSLLKGLVFGENKHSLFTLAPQPNTVHKFRIQSDDSLPGGVQSQRNLNLPTLLNLAQPFPNPARTRLSVNYALPRQTRVSIKLYDIAGKLVKTLASADQKPGYYNLTWNRQDAKGRTCACGVYFCTLAAEGQRFSRKVVLTE